MTPPPPTRWLTAEEATPRLGVSRQTLYAYVSREPDRCGRRAGRSAAQPVRRRRCAPARRTQPRADAADALSPPRRSAGASRSSPPRSPASRAAVWSIAARTRSPWPPQPRWRQSPRCSGRWTRCHLRSRAAARAWPRGAHRQRAWPNAASPRWRNWRWRAAGPGRVNSVLPDAVRILDRMAWAASRCTGAVGPTVATAAA